MKPPKFKPHMNNALGKYYYTEKDYKADMKKAGIEPYNPSGIKRPEIPAYARSEWAREMFDDIKNRKGSPPGDKFKAELAKRGYTQERYDQARRLADDNKR